VPSAYQEISSAHPYLPFFHRLESALKSLANFDPDDDDVVIIDDEEEIQACKEKSSQKREITEVLDCEDAPAEKRRKPEPQLQQNNNEWNNGYQTNTDPLLFIAQCNKQEEDLSDCEVICVTNSDLNEIPQNQQRDTLTSTAQQSNNSTNNNPDWRCTYCTFMNGFDTAKCRNCTSDRNALHQKSKSTNATNKQELKQDESDCRPGDILAGVLDSMAADYEQGCGYRPDFMHYFQTEMFWNRPANYAHALRLLGALLREPSSAFLIEPFAQNSSEEVAKSIVNPICFRDIVNALVGNEASLPSRNIKGAMRRGQLKVSLNWNMFYGRDFLEAIDLVILNGLVCYGRDKGTYVRTCLTKLRKALWDDINSKVRDRSNMPTKRSEKSGFVVRRKKVGR